MVVPLADEIRSRGYWWIVIHPVANPEVRVSYRDLEPTLARAKVQFRGWDFPHFDRPGSLRRKASSILQETDWNYYREIWEFYQTGQFTYLIGTHEDWTERSPGWGPPAHLAAEGPLLGVGDALFRFAETFAFATRLAQTPAGDDSMHMKLEIHGLNGRRLWVDSPTRLPLDDDYVTHADAYVFEDAFDRATLTSRFRSLAVDQALELYSRFGWNPSRAVVEGQLRDLRGVQGEPA